MDDNSIISYPLPPNQSARNIAIFKYESQEKRIDWCMMHEIDAWNRGLEAILDLLVEYPSIPRHYDAYINMIK